MTGQEFIKLSTESQELFLEQGGVVTNNLVQTGQQSEGCSPSEDNSVPSTVKDGLIVSPSSQSARLNVDPSITHDPMYDGFMVDDPVELLYMLDPNIASGRVTLHNWQIQVMLDFAQGGKSDKEPFQAVLRACNGSGKDKYIIASCVVWLCMRYKRALCVVTSSSGAQLDNQTCRYIRQLALSANAKFGCEMWDCKYREYTLDFSKFNGGEGMISSVFCFATDEAKKAEGYHPNDYGTKMGIFVSEDKSVPDEINIALNKCTGYTHRVHVSTPGPPVGHFYDMCSTAVSRKEITTVLEVSPTDYIEYHVTAHDCSHISSAYIQQMERDLPGGKLGAAYKSQVEAEFGTTDEMVVIPSIYVWKSYKVPLDHIPAPHNTGGLDLSDGGDETVLVVRNGNKHLKTIPFKFDNTEDTVAFLNEQFTENNLVHPEALIWADAGGLGKPILDRLKRQGWANIRYVINNAKAFQASVYYNRAAEIAFHVRKLMEQHELLLNRDDKLVKQLSARWYKITGRNIHQLLSKKEMRARGYASPDRADAFMLAFCDYKSTFVSTGIAAIEDNKPFTVEEKEIEIATAFDLKGWASQGTGKWVPTLTVDKNFSSLEDEIAEYNRQQLSNN